MKPIPGLPPAQHLINKAFRERGREDVVLWAVFPVRHGARVRISFERCTPEGRHGLWLMADEGIEIDGQRYSSVDLWMDTAPPVVDLVVHTSADCLHLYNIWEHQGRRESQAWTSGLLIETTPAGWHCRANDIGFAEHFDSLVFSVQPLVADETSPE